MSAQPAFVPCAAPLTLRSAASAWTSAQSVPSVSTPPIRRAVLRRAVVSAAAPLDIESEAFETEDIPVLVDFYASWCGPCKLVAPLMDWAASEFEGKLKVVKVNTEKDDTFVRQYNIHGLPTLAVFKNGEPVDIQEGAIGKAVLEEYILKHAPEVA